MRDSIVKLFNELHSSPEASGEEHNTKRILIDYLKNNTDLELHDMGKWFYAVHRVSNSSEGIAIRADMDAIKAQDGKLYHGCGHDGHCTILCSLAHELDNIDKNIFLLFQHGEENGSGARECVELFNREKIDKIYGLHNLPGYKFGRVYVRKGTMACASKGVTIKFIGKQSHAAYPEHGINPAFAISQLVSEFGTIFNADNYSDKVLATIVNIRVGEYNAFGVSAGEGELSVVIRAYLSADLDIMQSKLTERANKIASKQGIAIEITTCDDFPDTYNDIESVDEAEQRLTKHGIDFEELKEPMRWSEDFGHYLKKNKGVYFGIGMGEDYPALHTSQYCFDLSITDRATGLFKALIE